MTIAKITEITSISEKSFEDAIEKAVKRSCKTLKNVKSAWIKDQEVLINDDKITGYRVTLKITFVLK
jgi:flavin-binding protein dodecin